jgi:DNA-binding NtrC family response regulator
MIQNETRPAVVSPLDGVCGWLNRDSNSVTFVVPVELAGKVVAIGNYLKKYPDSTISEFADESELLSNLMEAKNKTVALDFSLALFDVAYSEPLRRKISAELDDLLTAKTTRDYVLDIMLSVPLPEECDVTTTLSYAGESPRVKELLKLIVDFQPRVRLLRNAWLAQQSVSASDSQQFAESTSAMVRLGIFRELVLCGDSDADLEGLKSRILSDKSIVDQYGTEIPIALVDRYAAQLKSGWKRVAVAAAFRTPSIDDNGAAEEFYRSTENLRQSGELDLQLSQAANQSLEPKRGTTEERFDYRLPRLALDFPASVNMRAKTNLLVIDDIPVVLEQHRSFLVHSDYNVFTAISAIQARGIFAKESIDLIILDDRLDETPESATGRDLLEEFRKTDPDIAAIFISGHEDAKTLKDVIRIGASDYLIKGTADFPNRLRFAVQRALAISEQQRQWRWMRSFLYRNADDSLLVGQSEGIVNVRKLVQRFASQPFDVLIEGETGTGKEVVASELHRLSNRSEKLFVPCNISTLQPNLITSELFGSVKGAYTDAVDRAGVFEVANGGTLFLDELGDLAKECQPSLLRVLENREFQRVGSSRTQKTTARVVAATNADLRRAIKAGEFREDLYQRFPIRISLPSLRTRREDIPHLVASLLGRISKEASLPLLTLTEESIKKLQNYDWPGNVRELRNTLSRAAVMCESSTISPEYIEFEAGGSADTLSEVNQSAVSYEIARKKFERAYWENILQRSNGNRSKAARLAGVYRPKLYERLRACGLHGEDSELCTE